MPNKELIVLLVALLIEVLRMLLVDVVVLGSYFNGDEYYVYRAPDLCDADASDSWQGADQLWYCDDFSTRTAATEYYLATSPQAFSSDSVDTCSTFTPTSRLLDFDREADWVGR